MSRFYKIISLGLSEEVWDKPRTALPRGMLQHTVGTTSREPEGHKWHNHKSHALFPEFDSPRDATAALDCLLDPSGLAMRIDGSDWWVYYNAPERTLVFSPCPDFNMPAFPLVSRKRYRDDPTRLELEELQPLVLFGQPRQATPKIYAAKAVAARNLFTLNTPEFSENVLLITDGLGKPIKAFLDRNNLY